MKKTKIVIGQKFGKWKVVGINPSMSGSSWCKCDCVCDCGTTRAVLIKNLEMGTSRSCGCLRRHDEVIGQRFGRLVVEAMAASIGVGKYKRSQFTCLCDCGTRTILGFWEFARDTKSCGCLGREVAAKRNKDLFTTHGQSPASGPSRTYMSWEAAKARCCNPRNVGWKNYGGRGIMMCERWLHSFPNFLADMGERPMHLTLDRINNDGNYEPGNCRWATWVEQHSNKRRPGGGRKINRESLATPLVTAGIGQQNQA